jgi:hypothetical protein
MIEEVQTLWRQLNGPQAVAFVRSIFKYFKDAYDVNLSYLYGLNIQSANEQHLNFIGTLMGIRRPFIQNELRYDKLLKFYEDLQEDNPQGFGIEYTDVDDQGGFFDSTLSYNQQAGTELIPTEEYRFLLQVVSEQEGSFRSLRLIDKVASRFINQPISYTLSYHPTIPGDIIIALNNPSGYRALLTKIVLNLFFLTAPTVHIIVEGTA